MPAFERRPASIPIPTSSSPLSATALHTTAMHGSMTMHRRCGLHASKRQAGASAPRPSAAVVRATGHHGCPAPTGVSPGACDGRAAPAAATRRHVLLGGIVGPAVALAAAPPPPPAWASAGASQVLEAVRKDFTEGQYYVTGNVTKALYDPKCRFVDPTITVEGVDRYAAAVAQLFDPATSRADLISIGLADDNTIRLRWRLEGTLRLGGIKIKPYTGTTLYVLDPATSLIKEHLETWDISSLDVFVSLFAPGFGAPPAPPV